MFAADHRVRRFSLTLAGEARLWYQSILGNSCFMLGDYSIMMRMLKQLMPICKEHSK